MIPSWLHLLSIASLLLGAMCALVIAADESRHPQRMWIMNAVWPLTALFGTVLWTWGYFRFGRLNAKDAPRQTKTEKPFAVMVAEGASHCGSGCTLGDICAEWLAFAVPAIAVALGWHSLFSEKMFAVWILDYIFAYVFGIVFHYYTIAPMRNLGVAEGIWTAVKADTLSLTAWQVGMYGFMALAYFWIFRRVFGAELEVASLEFWFVMQIAMLFGFLTSYPVNWWLLRAGLKEKM
jgi:branched-subunit amino acid transport protein